MESLESKGKDKAVDESSSWSWDVSQNVWVTNRIGSTGETSSYVTSSAKPAYDPPYQSTSDSSYRASSSNYYPEDTQSTRNVKYYEPNIPFSNRRWKGNTEYQDERQPTLPIPSLSSYTTSGNYISGTPGDPTSDECSVSYSVVERATGAASMVGATNDYSLLNLTNDFTNLNTHATSPAAYGAPQSAASQSARGNKASISEEKLGSEFHTIEQPSRFFKTGRVFKTPWTEPAGNVSDSEAKFVTESEFGQKTFTKVRRFVVAREMQGHSLCLPLNTHNRQATTKPGVRSQDYAAVYPLGGKVEYKPKEQLDNEPLPILVEDPGEQIDPMSRLNFGRVYTVEHNVQVQKIGRVPDEKLPLLNDYFVKTIAGGQVGTGTMTQNVTSPATKESTIQPEYGYASGSNNPYTQYSNSGQIRGTTNQYISEGYSLSSSSFPTTETSFSPFSPATPLGTKSIREALNTADYEELDPRYRMVDVKIQKNFWKVGRVFMMLWTEPARSETFRNTSLPGSLTGSSNGSFGSAGSHFSSTYLMGKAYTEIRRFVVIGVGYGNTICSPIFTYGGQATLKPNLPDADQHAIIYTSETPPAERRYYTEDGSVIQENLTKDPIRVKRELKDSEGNLDPSSRVNYSKVYTVENYVRVLNIGMVHPNSMSSLLDNCFLRPRIMPPQKPRTFPKKASSGDNHLSRERGSKDRGKKNRT